MTDVCLVVADNDLDMLEAVLTESTAPAECPCSATRRLRSEHRRHE